MVNDTWTVKDILAWTSGRFAQLDLPTPLLDAQLLLGSVLGLSKMQLYMHHDRVLSADERLRMRELVRRRLVGEPVAYLLGYKEWHELTLLVDSRVLIPRPETETLLDFVLDVFRSARQSPLRILDLCTGSGCLSIALGRRFPEACVFGVDVSSDALAVASENARRHGVSNVTFLCADVRDDGLLARLVGQAQGAFDVVVANPPYVSEGEWVKLDVGVRDFEPRLALVAEDEGLALAHIITREVMQEGILSANAVFAMEVGLAHCDVLAAQQSYDHLETFPYNTQSWKFPRGRSFALQDLTGRERFWCRLAGLPFEGAPLHAEECEGGIDPGAEQERLRQEAEASALALYGKDDGLEPDGLHAD